MIIKGPKSARMCKLLLKMEIDGLLERELCATPAYLDDESDRDFNVPTKKAPAIIPPRLLFIPSEDRLVHCVGEDAYYEANPEAGRFYYSEECYILDCTPSWVNNFDAMLPIYSRCGVVHPQEDPLSRFQARKAHLADIASWQREQRGLKREAARERKKAKEAAGKLRIVK